MIEGKDASPNTVVEKNQFFCESPRYNPKEHIEVRTLSINGEFLAV